MGNIVTCGKIPYNQTKEFIQVRDTLKNVSKEKINSCESCIARFWCFRCIGKYKKESNFGACKNMNECKYMIDLTEETLDKIAQYINEGKMDLIIKNLNEISELQNF